MLLAIPNLQNFNHASREGGDVGKTGIFDHRWISNHASREGGDANAFLYRFSYLDFNPRLP